MSKSKTIVALASLVALLMASACNTTGCMENQSAIPYAGFYSCKSLEKVSVDSLKVYGIGHPGDSSLTSLNRASGAYLPLRSTTSSTSFCLRDMAAGAPPQAADTLTLGYSAEPRFVSEECGAMYFYTIHSLTYTRNLIDSVALLDTLVTNTDIERIKIYFRTADNEDTPTSPDTPGEDL